MYRARTRTTSAPAHRVSQHRSSNGIYFTEAGEGIIKLTCDGEVQGLFQPVEIRRRADGTPLYFVESEQFRGRYYALYQQADGSWFFSGNSGLVRDSKLAERYIGKVLAFEASQQLAVAV